MSTLTPTPHRTPVLSIVVPVYNEASGIEAFHSRTLGVLGDLAQRTGIEQVHGEIIYVNDGSTDESLALLMGFAEADARVLVVDLSRNFGKEIAVSAGIDQVNSDAMVVIDADLQDPPELIPDMLAQWRAGFDCVLMQRASRDGETWLKKATSSAFYRVLARISDVDMPPNVGDFRLMSRRAVQALQRCGERTRYMKGLFSWVGFKKVVIRYQRDARFAGESKWNYWRLWNLALEGITSFSTTPLKIASYVGLIVAMSAFAYTGYVFVKALLMGDPVAGYPSLMVVVLFLGGTQLMALGIIGEYLARIFMEVKQRPLYVLGELYSPLRANAVAPSDLPAPPQTLTRAS